MKKRFLSLLLVLVLIMSLMPAALAVNADDAQPKTISVTGERVQIISSI